MTSCVYPRGLQELDLFRAEVLTKYHLLVQDNYMRGVTKREAYVSLIYLAYNLKPSPYRPSIDLL